MSSDGQDRQMLHTAVPVLASGAGSLPRLLQEVSLAARDVGERRGGIIDCTNWSNRAVNRDKTRGAVGSNQMGTLLIRIRAAVALDVQSDLNSQAAGVWSTSRPISNPHSRPLRGEWGLC
jgi:hypothetical protein